MAAEPCKQSHSRIRTRDRRRENSLRRRFRQARSLTQRGSGPSGIEHRPTVQGSPGWDGGISSNSVPQPNGHDLLEVPPSEVAPTKVPLVPGTNPNGWGAVAPPDNSTSTFSVQGPPVSEGGVMVKATPASVPITEAFKSLSVRAKVRPPSVPAATSLPPVTISSPSGVTNSSLSGASWSSSSTPCAASLAPAVKP